MPRGGMCINMPMVHNLHMTGWELADSACGCGCTYTHQAVSQTTTTTTTIFGHNGPPAPLVAATRVDVEKREAGGVGVRDAHSPTGTEHSNFGSRPGVLPDLGPPWVEAVTVGLRGCQGAPPRCAIVWLICWLKPSMVAPSVSSKKKELRLHTPSCG